MQRSGLSLSEMFFSNDLGILNEHPSRKLRASMKLVVESSEKNPEMAGGMLILMSNHMRDLANTDKEMRLKLSSTVDSMKNTAILFAPVIMGVTIGLYSLLSGAFGEMSGADVMPVSCFILVIGIYLVLTVMTIVYFCSGIEKGHGQWKKDVSIALPISTTIFCITSLGALLAFG